VSDRIELAGMRFDGHHGHADEERARSQPFDVDVTLAVDLAPAGTADDLELTVDYAAVYRLAREVVESTSFQLIEALAEAIAHAILTRYPLVEAITVRIHKPEVDLGGPVRRAGVVLERRRSDLRGRPGGSRA